MGTLSWALNIQVAGLATIVVPSDAQPYNALTQVQEVVKPNEERTVDIPAAAKDELELVVLRSDLYDEKLTVRTSSGGKGAKGGKRIALTEPLVLTRGALALLGTVPKQLVIKNGAAKTASLDAFVYRRTPQPDQASDGSDKAAKKDKKDKKPK